ncbi:hypothetical protein ABZ714_17915 [Streptomyces sp. NPDC006798]|uniref:hypothetical protein n=1 Tax=Streptomyces sp. NPDC006798 TaxID=3155462 RepID=UPI0033C3DAFA
MTCDEKLTVGAKIRELVLPCFPATDPDRFRSRIACRIGHGHAGSHIAVLCELPAPDRGHVWLAWCHRSGSDVEWGISARHGCGCGDRDSGMDCPSYDPHSFGLRDRPTPEQAALLADAFARTPTTAECETCRDLTMREKEAVRVGDYSRATDCRILRRRHQARGHQPIADTT